MKRWRIGLLVAWLSTLGGAAGVACSSSDDEDTSHAEGGTGTADAARDGTLHDQADGGGSDGDGGPVGAADADAQVYDPTSACRAYVAASCMHTDACHPQDTYYVTDAGTQLPPAALSTCLAIEDLCPEYVFGNGSTRTVAGTVACIADIGAFDCEAWNAGLSPACMTAGTLPAGSGCLSGIQCASSSCSGRMSTSPLACGTCTDLAADGQPCGAVGCVPEDTCTRGTCAPTVVAHGLDAGAACTPGAVDDCAAPYICGSTHTCVPNGACGTTVCTAPAICNPTTLHCDPPASFGESCAAAYCTDASACHDASPPTCGALLPAGSPCTSSAQCVPTTYCSVKTAQCLPYTDEGESCAAYGIECDPTTNSSPSTHVSTAKTGAVGVTCVTGSSGGNSCSGSNVCAPTADGGGVCAPPGLDPISRGAACTAPGAVCSQYLDCVGGTCALPIGDCSTFDGGVRDQ